MLQPKAVSDAGVDSSVAAATPGQRQDPEQVSELKGFVQRTCFALGPLGAALLVDALDLLTFGPVGLVLGPLVGGYVGWVLGEFEGLGRPLKFAFAICAALYMATPFTEMFPMATVLAVMARFFAGPVTDRASTPVSDEGRGSSTDRGPEPSLDPDPTDTQRS